MTQLQKVLEKMNYKGILETEIARIDKHIAGVQAGKNIGSINDINNLVYADVVRHYTGLYKTVKPMKFESSNNFNKGWHHTVFQLPGKEVIALWSESQTLGRYELDGTVSEIAFTKFDM